MALSCAFRCRRRPSGTHVCRCATCKRVVRVSHIPVHAECRPRAASVAGVGDQLASALKAFGIYSTAGCSCAAMQEKMNERGCGWCESPEGMNEIVSALRENAEKRGLPFVDIAARLLVRRAIHNARKAEARRAKEAEAAAAEGRPA